MRMLDGLSTAAITWQLTGRLGSLPLVVAGEDSFTLNLLTGLVEKHA